MSYNKGVYVINEPSQMNNHKPLPLVPATPKPLPSPSANSKAKDTKTVIIEQPRSITTALTRADFNPRSQQVLDKAYTSHRHFYNLNETILDQANDMKEDVWDMKGRPGEMLTYEQLIQGNNANCNNASKPHQCQGLLLLFFIATKQLTLTLF